MDSHILVPCSPPYMALRSCMDWDRRMEDTDSENLSHDLDTHIDSHSPGFHKYLQTHTQNDVSD
jgi:hypothetical protein